MAKHADYLNQEREGPFDKPEFRFDSKGRVVIPFPGKDSFTLSVTPGSKIISQGASTYTNKPMTDPASLRTGRLYAETVIQIGNSIYLDAVNECITVGQDGFTQWIMDSEYLRGVDKDDTIFGFFLQDTKIKEGDFSKGDVLIGNYPSSYIRYDNSNRRLLIVGDLAMAGDIASTNFVTGVSGYKLEYITGNAEFSDIYVRGGTVGGWTAGDSSLSAGNVNMQSTAERILLGAATAPLTGIGVFIGKDGSDYEFRAGDPTAHYLHWTGSVLNIKGDLSAGSISIGTSPNWFRVDTTGNIWSGHADFASGVFRVSNAGALTATSATITGAITATSGTIGSFTIGTYLYTGTKTAYDDTNAGVHLGSDGIGIGNNVFTVSSAGALVATSATITGAITANSGTIGSFTIGTYLYTGTKTAYNDANAGVHLGSDGIGIANNLFTVSSAGVINAVSGTIGGCTLSTTSIGSTTFVSGPLGSGWNISNTGNVEFQNATVRGIIRTSVFEKDTISAVNGIVLVSSADVLNADMTALDASTITITGETTFAANEVIRMKDGTDDEWMLVTNAASAPTYTVTRDLAGSYAADTNPVWKKGTAVVSMGVGTGTKTGFVLLDSSSANSPYIDIYGRNSNTYTDYTLHGRFGWLKGITDADVGLATTDVWGLYTDNAYIKGVIVANTGYIGGTTGWVIATGQISSVSGGNTTIVSSGATAFSAGPTGAPTITITQAGVLSATGASISGTLTATTGTIGGFTLAANSLSSGTDADYVCMSSAGTNAFWAGDSTFADAEFSVTSAGVLKATSATVTGTINATSGKFGTSTNYWSVGATGLTAVSASTDVIINYGKTDFGQDSTAGFILGYDYSSVASKFEIGSSTTKIFKYDGTDISLIGGTITGGTVQTASGTGRRVVLGGGTTGTINIYDNSNNNVVNFTSASSVIGTITQYTNATGLSISNDPNLTLTARLLECSVYKAGSSAQTAYFSNAGSGDTVQIVASSDGDGLLVSHNTGYGVKIVPGNTNAPALYVDNTYSNNIGLVYINSLVDSVSATTGITFNIVNNGAGNSYAFDFEGEEYDTTKSGVSTIGGVLKVYTSDGAIGYIPIYTTAS